jgi:hypothetical protein
MTRAENTRQRLQQRLKALASYLPILEQPEFRFATWAEFHSKEPVIYMDGNVIYSDTADAFVKMAYKENWVRRGFDWPEWKQTEEAAKLRDDRTVLERASAEQLAKLLTALIRQERFCEGELAVAFESGLLIAICRRAEKLLAELHDEK